MKYLRSFIFVLCICIAIYQPIVAPFNVTIYGSTRYRYDDMLELSCISEGSPELRYSWSRETSSGDMFPSSTTINSSMIIIYNLTNSDGGSYTCTVSNEAGNFSFTTTVSVDGKLLCVYLIVMDTP